MCALLVKYIAKYVVDMRNELRRRNPTNYSFGGRAVDVKYDGVLRALSHNDDKMLVEFVLLDSVQRDMVFCDALFAAPASKLRTLVSNNSPFRRCDGRACRNLHRDQNTRAVQTQRDVQLTIFCDMGLGKWIWSGGGVDVNFSCN